MHDQLDAVVCGLLQGFLVLKQILGDEFWLPTFNGSLASLPEGFRSLFSIRDSNETSSPSENFASNCRRLTVTNFGRPAPMPVDQYRHVSCTPPESVS